MDDPRTAIEPYFEVHSGKLKDKRSDLMKATQKAGAGTVPNFCPFGCIERELDGHGYCRHLVGFSEDQKTYEPMVMVRNRAGNLERQVRVDRPVLKAYDEDGKEVEEYGEPQLKNCKEGDRFVRITTHYRVYRNIPKPVPKTTAVAKAS